MLGTGVEPAPAINGGDFKSATSSLQQTVPPNNLIGKDNIKKKIKSPQITQNHKQLGDVLTQN
jgi:hypothetical protein